MQQEPEGACGGRSEEHTSELQSHSELVCRLLLEKKKASLFLYSASREAAMAGSYLIRKFSDAELSELLRLFFFFFNDTATTEIYTFSLHDALPIYCPKLRTAVRAGPMHALQGGAEAPCPR